MSIVYELACLLSMNSRVYKNMSMNSRVYKNMSKSCLSMDEMTS